ncbi:MAG: signal peptide peptidase SppA [Vulcanimicrobiota bacterium]
MDQEQTPAPLATPPPPPPPPRPRPEPTSGKVSPIWLVAVGCALLLSLVFNFFLFLGLVGAAGASVGASEIGLLEETLIDGKKDATDKIVVIPIHGVIMETMGTGPGSVSKVIAMLKKAAEDDSIKAVILDIDSPGGGVTASDRIFHEIKLFKAKEKLPIVSMFGDVAASGGYYVAMASDHIVAHETSITGSIGVISQFYNFHDAMTKLGVKVNTIKSLNSEGKESFKDIGSPYRPMTDPERKLLQGLITEMWSRFTTVVAEGRQGKLTPEQVKDLADGRVFTGPQALEQKLVDSIGYRQDAYKVARELAKSPDAKVVLYKRSPTLSELLSLRSNPPGSELLEMFSKDSPRFLYLWTGG